MIIFGLGLFMYAAWSALQCRFLPVCTLSYLLSAAMKIRACMGGIALCVHAAADFDLPGAADRDMLKLTQQEFASVPLLVKIEVLLAAVSCMWGELKSLQDLQYFQLPADSKLCLSNLRLQLCWNWSKLQAACKFLESSSL